MELKIKSLEMKNFKNHSYFKMDFHPEKTVIEGENASGKTSIGEAAAWCLTGCDLFGTENVATKFIKKNETEMYVKLTVELDGEQYEIKRSREKGVNEITVNGAKASQIDIYTKFVQDKNIFFSVFNPLYFTSLSPKDAKEILMKVLPDIPKEEIFKDMPTEAVNKLQKYDFVTANTVIEKARVRLKELEEDIIYLQGVIDTQKQLLNTNIPEEQFFDDENLKRLEEELIKLQKTEINTEKIEAEKKLAELKIKLNTVPFEKPQLKDTSQLQKQREELLQEYYKTKKEIEQIKPQIITCNKCGNKIEIESTEKSFLIKRLEQIKEKGTKVTAELKEITEENQQLIKAYEEKVKEHQEQIRKEIEEIENYIKSLTEQDLQKEIKTRSKIDEITAKINALKEKQKEVITINQTRLALIKQKEEAEIRLKEAEKKVAVAQKEIKELKELIEYAKQFNAKKLEKEAKIIDQYLDKVSLQLQKIVKETGEIKDDFKILYNGREFNIISHSEKIKAGLEVAALIIGLTNIKFPIFIDDAESITSYKASETQIIEAKVAAGKPLTAVNANMSTQEKELIEINLDNEIPQLTIDDLPF
ncbi:AAA domain [Thermoanaerobacter thermohydrosulfuricus]|uniref:Nuclease SbcCD subunit C n=1 Tax=Thermoanaerobacter thermohydrosulfuricus TaxID=1516 RepID=A0A1G7TA92_THETY|nr:AAA family ATPase [Thermoanaerobacter thermohydrosulfuricus]SDG32243.1 AAA domain [Thermoanaerobacter thermohydrosulfuricus]